MSTTEEPISAAAAVVAPQEERKPTEAKPKPAKEKKPRTTREKKATPHHPSYFQMIKEAMMVAKDKGGLSPYAIAKYMEEKYKGVLPSNYKKTLNVQLRNCVAKGKLVKVKGSFKLSESDKKGSVHKESKKGKKDVKKEVKETRKRKKPASSGAVKRPKKTMKKVKKATPAKPKSIKSPAAKRAKKASA